MNSPDEVVSLADAKAGSLVNVLVVVLGISGPTAYRSKTDGSQGYFTDLQIADSSCPAGVQLKFWGGSVVSVATVRPMLPVLFTGLSCRRTDRKFDPQGLCSFVWVFPSSAVVEAPPPSQALQRLTAWSDGAFGNLPAVARAGQATIPIALPSRATAVGSESRAGISREERSAKRRAVACHGRGWGLPRTLGTSALPGGSSGDTLCSFTRIHVLEAIFRKLPSQRSLRTLNGRVIQDLVTTACASDTLLASNRSTAGEGPSGGRTSASSAAKINDVGKALDGPHAHCSGCLEQVFGAFLLRIAIENDDQASERPRREELCVVRGRAAQRLFLGVRPGEAVESLERASCAASAVSDLVRESGPFSVLLSPFSQHGADTPNLLHTKREASPIRIAGQYVTMELVDIFV